MPRKIPEETKAEIGRLYNEGLKPSEIAKQTGVSYSSAYEMTRRVEKLAERGFKSLTEYQ